MATKSKAKRVRRAFMTMNVGHFAQVVKEDDEAFMKAKFEDLTKMEPPANVRAIALALEKGEKTGNWHIQGYVELRAGRSYAYYAGLFNCMETVFSEVKDTSGS